MSDRVPGNWQTDGHAYRRMEVTTGTPRRRSWTLADKARIVAESFSGDCPASEVALKHGIHRDQIYNWRRELAEAAGAEVADRSPFVPVHVAPPEPEASAAEPGRHDDAAGEVEFAGATVRVRDGANGDLVCTALAALSAPRSSRFRATRGSWSPGVRSTSGPVTIDWLRWRRRRWRTIRSAAPFSCSARNALTN